MLGTRDGIGRPDNLTVLVELLELQDAEEARREAHRYAMLLQKKAKVARAYDRNGPTTKVMREMRELAEEYAQLLR